MYGGEGVDEYEPSIASSATIHVPSAVPEQIDLSLRDWAMSRIANLGRHSNKITIVDDIVYDPLSYVITKYVNMPCNADNQMPIINVRKHIMMDYKTTCRKIGVKGGVRIYQPLTLPVKEVPDTCKLLAEDLSIFFVSTGETMSLCMLPQILSHRAMFTPEFFQRPDWRELVTSQVRQIPSRVVWEPLKTLLDADPISNAKPFTYQKMESARLELKQLLDRTRESFKCALDPAYPYDDRRLTLLHEVERLLVRAAARIVNINDVGLDGMGGYEDVNGERRNDISWITLQTMGQYSIRIRKHFGIRNLYDPFE
jgi:hypothetical protein